MSAGKLEQLRNDAAKKSPFLPVEQHYALVQRADEVRKTSSHLAQTANSLIYVPEFKRPIVLETSRQVAPGREARLLGTTMSILIHAAVIGMLSVLFIRPPASELNKQVMEVTAWEVEVPPPEVIETEQNIATIVAPEGLPLVMSALESPTTIPDPPEIAAPLPGDPSPELHLPVAHLAAVSLLHPISELRPRRPSGGGFAGRANEARALLVDRRGGSQNSEDAVVRANNWILEHQLADGSWAFDHAQCGCSECLNTGYATTTTGATGLALLPFLAVGQTHQRGEHREAIARGLEYLLTRLKKTSRGADLQDGSMYGQAIATIALCEAYALSHDTRLKGAAQSAIDFIVQAQHAEGGWRYYPNQAGDTTVFGWQMLALQTARSAELKVPEQTLISAGQFLKKVESRTGVGFGYQEPGTLPVPTAIGILSEMYLGQHPDTPPQQARIDQLIAWGPSQTDMYFNYYATQVLYHQNGPAWNTWNTQLRDHLLDSQSLQGHSSGSWFFPDRHAYAGGRLYTTAMCALILEIYYRHEPFYDAVDE